MRNLAILCLISIALLSCSVDDKVNNFYLETLPIETVIVPESFISGETSVIGYTYIRSSTCHIFNDLYYSIDGNQRTIAVINRVYEEAGNGNACSNLDGEIVSRTFDFMVNNESGTSYTFKFWQGEDQNGEDIYLTVNVPVIE